MLLLAVEFDVSIDTRVGVGVSAAIATEASAENLAETLSIANGATSELARSGGRFDTLADSKDTVNGSRS